MRIPSSLHVNNKGTDQSAHPRRLITSAFVIFILERFEASTWCMHFTNTGILASLPWRLELPGTAKKTKSARSWDHETLFMLNSTEHEIATAHNN